MQLEEKQSFFGIRELVVALALIATTSAAYSPVVHNGFVNLDDPLYVTENSHVQQGLTIDTLLWAFELHHTESYWHPCVWISLMLDYDVFGLNPSGYHVHNLILHVFGGLFLFLAFRAAGVELFISGAIAGFFLLHPHNVEATAWVAERKSVLSGVFWMAAMYVYILYTRRPSWFKYAGVFMLLLLGLASKPMLVVFPCAMLVLDYYPLNRFGPRYDDRGDTRSLFGTGRNTAPVLEKLPMFAAVAVAIVVYTISTMGNPEISNNENVAFGLRVSNAIVSYSKYISMVLFPAQHSVFYQFPESIAAWKIAASGGLLLLITGAMVVFGRKVPFAAAGWFWFLGVFVPAIGLMQNGLWPAVAERFLYLPAIGLFMLLAFGVYRSAILLPRGKRIVGVFLVVVLLVFGFETWKQTQAWRSSGTIFSQAIETTPNNITALNNLGNYYVKQGKYGEAKTLYINALAVEPGYVNAMANLGTILAVEGEYEQAREFLLRALKSKPDLESVRRNLEVVEKRLEQKDSVEKQETEQ